MKTIGYSLGLSLIFCTLTACTSSSAPMLIQPTCCPDQNMCYNSRSAIGQLDIHIIRIGDTVRIIVPSDDVFTIGTPTIKSMAYSGLDALARYLQTYGTIPMQVSAYSDDLGTPAENQWATEQQARNFVAFLWTRGLDHHLLTPVGMGENNAIASNRGVTGSAINRRIEITFRTDEST